MGSEIMTRARVGTRERVLDGMYCIQGVPGPRNAILDARRRSKLLLRHFNLSSVDDDSGVSDGSFRR